MANADTIPESCYRNEFRDNAVSYGYTETEKQADINK